MLAALNPLGVVAAAIFVAGILVGADSMSRAVNVPTYIADVIVSVSLLSMLVATLLAQYRIVFRRHRPCWLKSPNCCSACRSGSRCCASPRR